LCSRIAAVAEFVGGVRLRLAQASEQGQSGDDRRSGSRKIVARDGAAGGGGLRGFYHGSVGVKPQRPRKERDRERQRQDTDLLSRPTTPRGRSAARRAPRGARQGRAGLSSSVYRGCSAIFAEAMASASNEAVLDHPPAKVSAGQAAWKLLFRAKAREGGDSGTKRSRRVLVV
jgi:hypothetical protein